MRQCKICKKSYQIATTRIKLRGKYNPTGVHKQKANLQYKKIDNKRILVCTKCLKTITKKNAPKK